VGFRVLRNRRRVSGSVEIPGLGCLPVAAPPVRLERLGLALEWAETPPLHGLGAGGAWRILEVDPGGAGAAAGLSPGDWILAVDGVPPAARSLAPFEGLERQGRAAAITVRHEDRVRILLAQPAELDAG
jgi:predicted metalloprotease with PDZ domain